MNIRLNPSAYLLLLACSPLGAQAVANYERFPHVAIAPPGTNSTFTLSTRMLDFGAVPVGASLSKQFTIIPSSINLSTVGLSLSSTVPAFSLSATMLSIRTNTDVTVTFSPKTVGLTAGQVSVIAPASLGEQDLFVTGQGVSPLMITTQLLPSGIIGQQYQVGLGANGGTQPYTWMLTGGALPPGLSLNGNLITGIPATPAANYTFIIQVTDSEPSPFSVRMSYTISIGLPSAPLSVSLSSLAYSYVIGDANPPAQTLRITSGSTSIPFTINSDKPWIIPTPTSGNTPTDVIVSIDPTKVTGTGRTTGLLSISSPSSSNGSIVVSVTLDVTRPTPAVTLGAVTNAASFQGGAVAPGEIVTLFGQNFGPPALNTLQLGTDGRVTTMLSNTRVLFDGFAAPMVYVEAGQLSCIVPYSVAAKATTVVQVEYQGVASNGLSVPVAPSSPALFTINSSGSGPGAILNADNSVNSDRNPVDKGGIVVLYATGEGQTDPPGIDGKVAGSDILPKPILPVSAKVGGIDAEVLYAGAAPGLVSGVLQVNVRIPLNVPSGSVPVTLTVGQASSKSGVTVSVR